MKHKPASSTLIHTISEGEIVIAANDMRLSNAVVATVPSFIVEDCVVFLCSQPLKIIMFNLSSRTCIFERTYISSDKTHTTNEVIG